MHHTQKQTARPEMRRYVSEHRSIQQSSSSSSSSSFIVTDRSGSTFYFHMIHPKAKSHTLYTAKHSTHTYTCARHAGLLVVVHRPRSSDPHPASFGGARARDNIFSLLHAAPPKLLHRNVLRRDGMAHCERANETTGEWKKRDRMTPPSDPSTEAGEE